jgi:hypothetical protein
MFPQVCLRCPHNACQDVFCLSSGRQASPLVGNASGGGGPHIGVVIDMDGAVSESLGR